MQMHLVAFSAWCLLGLVAVAIGSKGRGTPKRIEDIVIGRCEEYQTVLQPDIFKAGTKNCTDLWVKFRQAFVYKDPCNVAVESYRDFVEAADHAFNATDKVMYWSGAAVFPLVVDYVSHRSSNFVTIREILAAYVVRNVEDWCGQLGAPGINYNQCPSWGTCPLLATTSFWAALSKNFAMKVKGTVHVMLSGSSGHAYLNTSIFAQSELKNLNAERTPVMHVHLVYDLNGPIRERCGEGTLNQLQRDVEKKGMKYKCSDDDLELHYFQCTKDMSASKCKTLSGSRGAATAHSTSNPLFTYLFALAIVSSTLIA